MEIKVCTTKEWTEQEWDSYITSFNEVFERGYPKEYFRHKYLATLDGCSYHALLLNDAGEAVGACSVIPYHYRNSSVEFKNGLAVDVFIVEPYRTDPLMLRRMYKKLTKLLVVKSVVAVMAVPNATAYPYWRNVVKWKDVGSLRYWAVPVRAGNIVHKSGFINLFSRAYCSLILGISSVLCLLGGHQKNYKYSIIESELFLRERFGSDYCCEENEGIKNCYRIVDEEGVRTAYLIYSRENGTLSFRSLYKGVSHILKHHDIDLILYVGPLSFFQSLFFLIPRQFEPKLLPLTCDLLLPQENSYNDIWDFSNWDFGLLNYDVR